MKRLSECPMLKQKKRQPRNELTRRRNEVPFNFKLGQCLNMIASLNKFLEKNACIYSTLNQLLRCLF